MDKYTMNFDVLEVSLFSDIEKYSILIQWLHRQKTMLSLHDLQTLTAARKVEIVQ